MKYLLAFLSVCLLFLSMSTMPSAQSFAAGSNPYCLGMTGKFTATNWPGGTIMVACAGDTGTAGCTGEIATLHPGDTFDFNNCTCPPYASESIFGKSGCLVVGSNLSIVQLSNGNRPVQGSTSLPPGCTINPAQPVACGSNGTVINAPFSISCTAPTPTPTPTRAPTPTPTPTRIPTPTPTPIPSATPTPSPTACPAPSQVLNVHIACPNCSGN